MRFDGAQIILGFFGLLFFIGFVGAAVAVAIGGKARTERNGADVIGGFCAFLALGLLAAAFISAGDNDAAHETRRKLTQRGYIYENVSGVRRIRTSGDVVLRLGDCTVKVALNDERLPVLYRDGEDVVLSPRDVQRMGDAIPECRRGAR